MYIGFSNTRRYVYLIQVIIDNFHSVEMASNGQNALQPSYVHADTVEPKRSHTFIGQVVVAKKVSGAG